MVSCDPAVAPAPEELELPKHRKPWPYTPSPWGDFFLSHQPCTPSQLLSMKERARVKEEEARQIVRDTFASSSSDQLALKLELVDTLQRIGVGYRYGEEIDELLRAVHRGTEHQEGCRDDDELYVTSLRFYLLRKHSYSVSSDVFVKFRDDQGNFASDDVNCLLMLYDAAHLRTRGEEVLDSAIAFTKNRLQSVMDSLEPELAKEVQYTLETPRYRRVGRVEARRYISVYERKAAATRNHTILELAKLDYSILQALYCEELKALTIWWKDLRSWADLRFARERVVEMYFWMLGVVYEPQYSYPRILLTKFFKLVSLIDDFCDSYSTTEEIENFTIAIERWDEQDAELFPAYMKALYINILHNINDIIQELKLRENSHAELVKELLIDITQCYHAEVKWRDEHYVPAKVEEHLQLSAPSSACMHITNLAFISLGDVATKEAIGVGFLLSKNH
ncbi:(E)-beta-farnesene synthase [Dichanthelium oligosanthes]|uniref:(E)-beta-farnesene synthase n=1 Tax=Dichanthelium oligosanthes TaxID=888268 RepID=A0A1E5UIB4_9POAL|nr:(E)-beta-farnesene synthase [Dichanthelium oligosanthes]